MTINTTNLIVVLIAIPLVALLTIGFGKIKDRYDPVVVLGLLSVFVIAIVGILIFMPPPCSG